MEKERLPKIGGYYHFFDDGKTGPNRHYICRVEDIISVDDSKRKFINVDGELKTLFNIWKDKTHERDFLHSSETDYFLEISCPTYDKYLLYAIRTKRGYWFTMDIQSSWQGGRVDVESKVINNIINSYKNSKWPDMVDKYPEANEENYLLKR